MLSSSYLILRSKILLYIVTLISLFYILMLGMTQEYIYIVIFALVGYLTTFFSKNMIVVSLIALAVTNIIRLGRKATVNEGLDTMEGEGSGVAAKPAVAEEKAKKTDTAAAPTKPSVASPLTSTTTDSANNLLNKLSTAMNTGDGSKADIATLQKKATELVSTQDKLMENMSQLGPLLEKAESFLNKYEGLKGKVEGMKTLKADLQKQAEGMRNMKEGFTGGNTGVKW
jgi:hypothetical protein